MLQPNMCASSSCLQFIESILLPQVVDYVCLYESIWGESFGDMIDSTKSWHVIGGETAGSRIQGDEKTCSMMAERIE
jgi:hypothetical protein